MADTITAREARQQLIGHRFYRYRGCAPEPAGDRVGGAGRRRR
jgi:hypothetical protein